MADLVSASWISSVAGGPSSPNLGKAARYSGH